MTVLTGIDPYDLDLPYEEFRPEQVEAIEFAANSTKRFIGLCAPGGCGKTGIALGLAQATGERTLFLSHTIGLQDQYMAIGAQAGLVDIRGKERYVCEDLGLPEGTKCKHGARENCEFTGGPRCPYEFARYTAKRSRLVNSNYSYWLRVAAKQGIELSNEEAQTEGRNPFGCLVLDEAHLAAEQLASSIGCVLRESHLKECGVEYDKDEGTIGSWVYWAAQYKPWAEQEFEAAVLESKEKNNQRVDLSRRRADDYERLIESMDKILTMTDEDWLVEKHDRGNSIEWSFDCVWPARYAERYLFAGVPKVVLMSATLRPVAMRLLGLYPEDYDWREWPRIFPAINNPVYHWPAISATPNKDGSVKTVRLSRNTPEADWDRVIENIDKFIDVWGEWKGIIHTGSYDTQTRLRQRSRHAASFFSNTRDPDSPNARSVCDDFKRADPPAILVSPSFSTGWDFPGDTCRWIIVVKIPYPATHTKVMMARDKKDKMYIPNIAMQDMVQGSLRGVRFMEDWCAVLITDGNMPWFMHQYKQALAPSYFNLQTTYSCPQPSPRWKNGG